MQDQICEHCDEVIDQSQEHFVVSGNREEPDSLSWWHTGCYEEMRASLRTA